jgi:hypothetical protein
MNRKENFTKQITESCSSKEISVFLDGDSCDEAIQDAPIKNKALNT